MRLQQRSRSERLICFPYEAKIRESTQKVETRIFSEPFGVSIEGDDGRNDEVDE